MNYEKARQAFSKMPTLRHSIPGKPFEWNRSEVAAWLASRPEALAYLFGVARHSNSIVYDPATGTWCGRDRRTE